MAINLDQKQRESARWAILQIAEAGRPIAVNGAVVLRVLADEKLISTSAELRRELDYLKQLGLIQLEDDDEGDADSLLVKLTPAGVDVVEYTTPAPAGVGRPKQFSGMR